jgi:hypothetical protein
MMSLNRVPTSQDWGDPGDDLDRQSARKVFFGKSIEDIQDQFRKNPMPTIWDLKELPEIPFRYYTLAFRDFVLSPALLALREKASYETAQIAQAFLDLIAEKLEQAPADIAPIMPELIKAAEHVASHQKTYRADPGIYGNFGAKIRRIRSRWKALAD